ncbi:hypothetical protein V8E52_010181 [Russula decolorans]|jgi:hypothetical protein
MHPRPTLPWSSAFLHMRTSTVHYCLRRLDHLYPPPHYFHRTRRKAHLAPLPSSLSNLRPVHLPAQTTRVLEVNIPRRSVAVAAFTLSKPPVPWCSSRGLHEHRSVNAPDLVFRSVRLRVSRTFQAMPPKRQSSLTLTPLVTNCTAHSRDSPSLNNLNATCSPKLSIACCCFFTEKPQPGALALASQNCRPGQAQHCPCCKDDTCVEHVSVPQAPSTQLPSTIVSTPDTRENQSPSLRTMALQISSYSAFCIVVEYLIYVCLTSFVLAHVLAIKPRVPPVIIIPKAFCVISP